MSIAITYWWKKYMILRLIKQEYIRASRYTQEPKLLREEYFEKLIEAIN